MPAANGAVLAKGLKLSSEVISPGTHTRAIMPVVEGNKIKDYQFEGDLMSLRPGMVVVKFKGDTRPTSGSCGGPYLDVNGRPYAVHFALGGDRHLAAIIPHANQMHEWKPTPEDFGKDDDSAHWAHIEQVARSAIGTDALVFSLPRESAHLSRDPIA
jgi:hypothetical protein